jgi:hypothetical protein
MIVALAGDDPHQLTQNGGLRIRLNPPYELRSLRRM